MHEYDYVCMACGTVDGNVMVTDERSEAKKQWENSECDGHATCQSSSKSTGLPLLPRSGAPSDPAYKRAFTMAQKTARLFSVETDQIPAEATCMYMATRQSAASHCSSIRAIACTMIVAHRRTAQDIEDVTLAFALKFKNIATAIEDVQKVVHLGTDKTLAATYGYLFQNVADRRPAELVKEAMNHLLELAQSHAYRAQLSASSWGIRALADVMMTHILDSKLTGGGSLQLMARAMIVMAGELHGLSLSSPQFVSACILAIHRSSWKAAALKWPGGVQAFDTYVVQKRRIKEYGSSIRSNSNGNGNGDGKKRQRPVTAAGVTVEKAHITCKRKVRSQVTEQFATQARFATMAGTATAAGVTHLCVTSAGNAAVCAFLDRSADSVGTLVDVCLAAVKGAQYPGHIDKSILDMITGTAGFEKEVALAQGFRAVVMPKSCFIPRELMCWGK